jgi:hypothetical protein
MMPVSSCRILCVACCSFFWSSFSRSSARRRRAPRLGRQDEALLLHLLAQLVDLDLAVVDVLLHHNLVLLELLPGCDAGHRAHDDPLDVHVADPRPRGVRTGDVPAEQQREDDRDESDCPRISHGITSMNLLTRTAPRP